MMERRVRGNLHARCEAGEKTEITSNSYLSLSWHPGDLEQRKGRIVRQGNKNAKVHIYRYVTEGTFDSYLWQTVENKQKFISQIMTSKSPVRSCEDVDETALSYAEIKALCAGDPRIKERMELDVEVSKLKIMRADHQSKQFRMEDQLLKYFPEEIKRNEGLITGFQQDMETLAAHPHPTITKEVQSKVKEDGNSPAEPASVEVTKGFAGIVINGQTYTDRETAGEALLEAVKSIKDLGSEPVEIGSYRGFTLSVSFSMFKHEAILKGAVNHRAELGKDPRGNLTRLDNALERMPDRLKNVQAQLENLIQQREATRAEVGKPFPLEADYKLKTARLAELDASLNIDGRQQPEEQAVAKSERPSVLEKLSRQQPPREKEEKPKRRNQER